jgi:hypothetical protein
MALGRKRKFGRHIQGIYRLRKLFPLLPLEYLQKTIILMVYGHR